MDSLHWSSRSPIGVIVIAVFLGLLGLLSLSRLPLQLFPDINKPELSIQTGWRTASPEEVESELLEPLENVMQGMAGVEEIEGNALPGAAQLNLRFTLGTDMKNALVEVIGRLNRLPPLPRDADRPSVSLGGNGNTNETLSWFFVQLLPGTPGPIQTQRRFIEDTVRARLESIPGVAAVQVNAGPPDDVRITLDLVRAAALGITVPDVANRAASATNVSGGQLDVGRRQYTLRFTGRFSPEQLGGLVLAWRDGRPVRLADIATIDVAPPARQFFGYQNGNPAIGIQVFRANGANVLATLEAVKAAVAELRAGALRAHGLGIEQSFDASLFIRRAVTLLTENLVIGALLALIVVWWFMREWRVTLLIAATIPVCLCATFIALDLFGRSLNVISLAGLAFAVGMVVEGAIVVSKIRENANPNFGFNAQTDTYEDLVASGVIDPTKVTRSALQNASSIASLMLMDPAPVLVELGTSKTMIFAVAGAPATPSATQSAPHIMIRLSTNSPSRKCYPTIMAQVAPRSSLNSADGSIPKSEGRPPGADFDDVRRLHPGHVYH